jgi:hypothetical protein
MTASEAERRSTQPGTRIPEVVGKHCAVSATAGRNVISPDEHAKRAKVRAILEEINTPVESLVRS